MEGGLQLGTQGGEGSTQRIPLSGWAKSVSQAWLTLWKTGEVQAAGCGVPGPAPSPPISQAPRWRGAGCPLDSPQAEFKQGRLRSVNTSGPTFWAPSLDACAVLRKGHPGGRLKVSNCPTFFFFSISGFHQKVRSPTNRFTLACSHSLINSLADVF